MPAKAQFPEEQSEEESLIVRRMRFATWFRPTGPRRSRPRRDAIIFHISLACPWASRTLIVWKLMGLQKVIDVTVVDPVRDERGWAFRDGPGYSATR